VDTVIRFAIPYRFCYNTCVLESFSHFPFLCRSPLSFLNQPVDALSCSQAFSVQEVANLLLVLLRSKNMADESDKVNEQAEMFANLNIKNSSNSYTERVLSGCSQCDDVDERIRKGFAICAECLASSGGC